MSIPAGPSFDQLHPEERQAVLERLAMTLDRNTGWADAEGDDALGMVMRSVGTALLSVARDLATTETVLAEDVAGRAVGLIATFHVRQGRHCHRIGAGIPSRRREPGFEGLLHATHQDEERHRAWMSTTADTLS